MKVIDIKRKGKSENYIVSLDNGNSYLLTLETIIIKKIKVNSQLQEDEFADILIDNQKKIGFEQTLNLLSKGQKTKKQIETYLKDKGYLKQAITDIVKKLMEYKYIDDCAYAQMFVCTYADKKGINWIKQQLFQKGVDSKIIDSELKNINSQKEIAVLMAEKLMKNAEKNEKNKQKLYRNLLGKGFNYEDVKYAMNCIFKGETDDWN